MIGKYKDHTKSNYRAIIAAGQEWRLPSVKEALECSREAVEGTRIQIRKDKRYLRQLNQALVEMKESKSWHTREYSQLKHSIENTKEGIEMLMVQLYEERFDLQEIKDEYKNEVKILQEFLIYNSEVNDFRYAG